ncbi:sulfurtransferase [Paenibacillus sp. FSL H7-0331]|uniref:sulfurtransferase n=1 Tax=Paenibacillus sp. FSL H7-0331 TaxID=1920421 RepID=UPI00269EFBF7|nr:rhodanese-like domain-containing protein [Paenibacillus sp. FSL H7-0331]
MTEVQAKLGQPGTLLLDSREAPRYLGEVEPIDKAAGHIPDAINKFWKDVLDEQGRFKDESAITENYARLPRDKEIIVYCGSGVTSTPNILGLSEAGFKNVKLYAGSWSDWISYEENPMAIGEE